MDAILFLKEKTRMTKDCAIWCSDCPLQGFQNGKMVTCNELIAEHPEKAVEIVEEWSRENPVKTMMDDFFEKFPNAPKMQYGNPKCCPFSCGYGEYDKCRNDPKICLECWSRPLEVTK